MPESMPGDRCPHVRSLLGLLLAALLLSWPNIGDQARAQDGNAPFTLTAAGAFGGHFKVGDWYPVVATIENTGPDTAVEIRATTGPDGGELTAVIPVDLPAGARKQVTLYTLPESLPREFDVLAVQTRGGEAVASAAVTLDPLFPTETLCGAAGYKGGALAALERVNPSGGDGLTLAPVSLATFPDRGEGLDSFDCLVIGAGAGADATAALGPAQQAALTDWVERGGQLFVAAGERWQTAFASIPTSLLPVTVDATESVTDLSGLAAIGGAAPQATPVVVARAAPKPEAAAAGAWTLAASGDRPLVVEYPVGRGVVHFLAFDPAANPLATWDGMDAFWTALLRGSGDGAMMEGRGPADVNPRLMETAPLVGALSMLPALDLPSLRLLAVLLAVYVAAVSPLNYLVLKRLHKLSWAWASTLLLVAIFALGAYGVGRRIRGNDIVVNRLSVIQADAAAGTSPTARTYIALFSPSKSDYDVQLGGANGDALVSPMPASADPWSPWAKSGGGATVIQTRPAEIRDFGVGQWASRFFMAEHHPSGAPAVTADLRFEGNALRGTVTNTGETALDGCAVFVGADIAQIGALGPGETKEIELSLSTNSNADNMGMPLSMRLLGADPNGGWMGPTNDAAGRRFQSRQMILDSVFGYGMTGSFETSGVNLVGWSDSGAGALPIAIDGRTAALHDTTLFSSRLPVSFAGDTVSLPAGTMAPRLAGSDASSVSTFPEIQVYDGWADFDFTPPPAGRPATVTALSVHLPDWGMGGPSSPVVSVYDWTTGEYVELDDDRGEVEVEDPARFADPVRGTVRVRLQSTGPEPIYTTLGVSLTGERGTGSGVQGPGSGDQESEAG